MDIFKTRSSNLLKFVLGTWCLLRGRINGRYCISMTCGCGGLRSVGPGGGWSGSHGACRRNFITFTITLLSLLERLFNILIGWDHLFPVDCTTGWCHPVFVYEIIIKTSWPLTSDLTFPMGVYAIVVTYNIAFPVRQWYFLYMVTVGTVLLEYGKTTF